MLCSTLFRAACHHMMRSRTQRDKPLNVFSDEDFSVPHLVGVEEKIKRIKNSLPDSKLVVVLRHPYEVARSFYFFYTRNGKISCDFKSWVSDGILNHETNPVFGALKISKLFDAIQNHYRDEDVITLDFQRINICTKQFLEPFYAAAGLDPLDSYPFEKRNEKIPGSAVYIANNANFLWRLRGYIPKSARRGIKSALKLIPSKSVDPKGDVRKKITAFYEADIQFVNQRFGLGWE